MPTKPGIHSEQDALAQRPYFFDAGICFACRQCGACCTGEPGTVYVDAKEINDLAQHFQISTAEFIRRYLYPFKDSYSIREDAQGSCVFFEDGCTIYGMRPRQCRTFPFWFENLRGEKRWQRVARQCPGIGSGRLYSREEIMTMAAATSLF